MLFEYWYFQVYTRDAQGDLRPWVDSRSPDRLGLKPPPLEDFPMKMTVSTIQLDGAELFDLRSPFSLAPNCPSSPGAERDGYIRLGISQEALKDKIEKQILQVAAITLLSLVIFSALVWWLARRLFPIFTPAAVAPAPGRVAPNFEASVTLTAVPESSIAHREPTPIPEPTLDHRLITAGDLVLDDLSKQVKIAGQPVELSPKEYEILKLLASQPGRVFSNEEILRTVWKDGSAATSQDVKQYIYFLRRKLEKNPQHPHRLVTVRGFGYKLNR
jgi:hypothetical protein